jgi:hypothetical protein
MAGPENQVYPGWRILVGTIDLIDDVALDDHGLLDFAGPDSSHYHISQDDFGEREKVPSELRRP